jgi:hypothetical protein
VYLPENVFCASGRYCFMEEFARFWAYNEGACYEKGSVDCQGASGCAWHAADELCYSTTSEDDYPGLPSETFINMITGPSYKKYIERRRETLAAYTREYENQFDAFLTGFSTYPDGGFKMAWVSFNATYPRSNTVEEANDWYDKWDEYRERWLPNIGGFHTTSLYLFMVTQNEMVKAAVLGICLSLVITFIILTVTTQNWMIAGLGLINIVAISGVFLGIVPLIDWSLGENECIFLIAVVGLSVDYTVHLLNCYNGVTSPDRESRVRMALGEMGISVVNSALTTVLAAAILFGCGFYFFMQFGAFIFFVIGFSIVMSIFFLMPMMMLFGPENESGRLGCWRRMSRKAYPNRRVTGKDGKEQAAVNPTQVGKTGETE